jgi:AcrR family transcriptional regulator
MFIPMATKDDKRELILDAALDLFEERGFHGTAVPLVAERAGVGAGTLYRYFESKEALVNALYQRWKGLLGRSIMNDFPVGAAGRQQFHWFWNKMRDFAEMHPKAFAFLEFHAHAPYLDDTSRAMEQQVLNAARAFMAEAQRNQTAKDIEPDVLIGVVWGAFVGLVKGAHSLKLQITPAAFDAAEQCCWEAIRK